MVTDAWRQVVRDVVKAMKAKSDELGFDQVALAVSAIPNQSQTVTAETAAFSYPDCVETHNARAAELQAETVLMNWQVDVPQSEQPANLRSLIANNAVATVSNWRGYRVAMVILPEPGQDHVDEVLAILGAGLAFMVHNLKLVS